MRTLVLHFNEETPRWGEGGQWCHTHSFIPPSPLLSSPHLSISLNHPLKRKGKICKGKPLSLNILHACPGHFRQHVNPQSRCSRLPRAALLFTFHVLVPGQKYIKNKIKNKNW
uniref:Uncharacterized protein n=1 Tax=Anguilla anguilla TaxID=7936 RepID=A0A0E9WED9_ANGAN